MVFGELICKLRGYHKFNYYYSGQCITCGEMRKESQEKVPENNQLNEKKETVINE
ncbi:hypothetical protein [Niallia sp. 03133]|uniref:hypothetical protein n=1 Tax=Niallia sp. 03133 TaxID=3458060 RepID=UPI00404510F1